MPRVVLGIAVMSLFVVMFNRLFWRHQKLLDLGCNGSSNMSYCSLAWHLPPSLV